MFKDPKCIYHREMINRYWQLRHSWLSEKSLNARLNALVTPLLESGAVEREQARWSGDSDINGLPLNIVGERDYIIDWMHKRLAHLDRTLMRHPCDINGDGAVTAYDIVRLQSYVLDGGVLDSSLDVNGDGTVTCADLTTLYEYILGLK